MATGVICLAVVVTVILIVQAALTVYMMIYTWDQPEANAAAAAPFGFEMELPDRSFTILLPAKKEVAVIQTTIQLAVAASKKYLPSRVEIKVVCDAGETDTIATVRRKIGALAKDGVHNVQLITYDGLPISKPHGLNEGLRQSHNEVVTIFDAEDQIHPDILNIVNTVMVRDGVRVVQCGVQLMNYHSSWYSVLNVLEYFFWFRSRLHYHAKMGMIPLGGNTVFFAREVVEALGGWDEHNLTEDADMGIRLSAMRERVRVIYDDRFVTKEETPRTLDQFVRQRTRWSQGFLQTLRKGTWLNLPNWPQRLLAVYTLGFPTFQTLLALYLPFSLWMMVSVKMPVVLALFCLIPFYLLLAHYCVSVVGFYEFASAHGLRPPLHTLLIMALGYLPYQYLLAYAALRALVREARGFRNWEKTEHVGAHRGGS